MIFSFSKQKPFVYKRKAGVYKHILWVTFGRGEVRSGVQQTGHSNALTMMNLPVPVGGVNSTSFPLFPPLPSVCLSLSHTHAHNSFWLHTFVISSQPFILHSRYTKYVTLINFRINVDYLGSYCFNPRNYFNLNVTLYVIFCGTTA